MCSPDISVNYLQYVIPPAGSVPVKDTVSGNWIFPIPGTGFGLSFYNLDQRPGPMGDFQNPTKSYTGTTTSGGRFYIRVMLWKLPGAENPGNVINFDGFQVVNALQPVSGSDNWSNLPNNGPSLISNTFTTNTAVISGNITLSTGTCDFDNKNVPMGSYDVSSQGADRGAPSPWKDASFTLKCPPAMGYGRTGSVNTSDNTVRSRSAVTTGNRNLNITVVPRTEIIDNTKGIMALNSGGAEGYGIQLFWNPVKPVIFNTPMEQATNVFTVGSTNNIKVYMSARYVRTEGEVQTGPANAVVEIIANYN
jgi:hypothetical protein